MESGPVTLAEDSSLFDSTPSEEGAAFAPASGSEHEVALFDSPASTETSSGTPSDEETGLFGDTGTSEASSSDETLSSATDEAPPDSSSSSRSARRTSGKRRPAKADRGRFHAPAK